MKYILILTIVFLVVACGTKSVKEKAVVVQEVEPGPVAWSISGEPFYEPERTSEQQRKLEENLAAAQDKFDNQALEINCIWLGRRLAYMARYPEAIEVYTQGLKRYPESYKLYRHRGHRYISIRKFDEAIADLNMAAELMPKDLQEIEPDGIPNKLNQPLSSTQFNVWYHLGLAYYLKGEYEKALDAYLNCMKVSTNDDLLVATSDWLYMTYLRLGQRDRADSLVSMLPDTLTIIENSSYYERIKMYKGSLSPMKVLLIDTLASDYDVSLATQGYGVANYYISNGDTTKGTEILNQVLSGKHWSAFGYIAAEADMHSLNRK